MSGCFIITGPLFQEDNVLNISSPPFLPGVFIHDCSYGVLAASLAARFLAVFFAGFLAASYLAAFFVDIITTGSFTAGFFAFLAASFFAFLSAGFFAFLAFFAAGF